MWACLRVAFVVGEVDHQEQLQVGLHLRQQRSGRSLPCARSELHITLRVHWLRERKQGMQINEWMKTKQKQKHGYNKSSQSVNHSLSTLSLSHRSLHLSSPTRASTDDRPWCPSHELLEVLVWAYLFQETEQEVLARSVGGVEAGDGFVEDIRVEASAGGGQSSQCPQHETRLLP